MKRGVILIFTILFISLMAFSVYAEEYDLSIEVIVEGDLIPDQSNKYKIVVENLDYESGQEDRIDFEIKYWIRKDGGDVLNTFPKTSTGDLKTKKTFSRSYKFTEQGKYEICATILNSEYDDPNNENNSFCLDVYVGEEPPDEEEEEEEEEQEEEEQEEDNEEENNEEEKTDIRGDEPKTYFSEECTPEIGCKEQEEKKEDKETTQTITGEAVKTQEYKTKNKGLTPFFIGLFVALCLIILLIIIFKRSKV